MTDLRETTIIALSALRANRMRSSLTMLGVVIGVAAVIAMVSVGAGATQRISQQIQSIGSNLIIVMPGSLTSNGIRLGSGAGQSLTEDDAAAIREECPSVAAAAPIVRTGAQVMAGNNNWATVIYGTTPDYLLIRDYQISDGQAFGEPELDSAAKVALIGQTVAEQLFGTAEPVGKSFRIRNVPFTVSGVLAPKGQSPGGQDQDDVVIIPLSTAKRQVTGANMANARSVGSIMVQAISPKATATAVTEVQALLRQRHHTQQGQDDDFTVRNLSEMLEAQEASAQIMALLLGAIASVSLIVGGIGIMNIMLVSVTERTKEIGIRRALGARNADILTQFLVEAITLSALGGVVGIGLGAGASWIIARVSDWSVLLSPGAIVLAFTFSALVGMFFGWYPARKAAHLDPVVALRYE
jgi:putative ABC transport system permease protein